MANFGDKVEERYRQAVASGMSNEQAMEAVLDQMKSIVEELLREERGQAEPLVVREDVTRARHAAEEALARRGEGAQQAARALELAEHAMAVAGQYSGQQTGLWQQAQRMSEEAFAALNKVRAECEREAADFGGTARRNHEIFEELRGQVRSLMESVPPDATEMPENLKEKIRELEKATQAKLAVGEKQSEARSEEFKRKTEIALRASALAGERAGAAIEARSIASATLAAWRQLSPPRPPTSILD